jgi:3-methyl-2-oxobutanoate hydroxymethyltransferase
MARITLPDLARVKQHGGKIAMVTAYDTPSARLAEQAGVDCVLVGDSAAMTVLGHESTLPVTMEEMLMLTRAVARGTRRALLVADMPFGSFQVSTESALENAVRFLKEGGADAVKVEGAGAMLPRVAAMVAAGIPVMGHIGLTPQSATQLGGYKPQGRTAVQAQQLVRDALALEQAGCFAIVLEAMPELVARRITATLRVPTIGIGAGAACDGQVLVWHDLLGWEERIAPRFVKRYAAMAQEARAALGRYAADVRERRFPAAEHVYPIADAEWERLQAGLAAHPPAARSPETVAW